MPNWKKLVVSGSDAHLNSLNVATSVTASFLKGDGSAITNITASYFGAGLVTASNDFSQVTFTKDSGDTFLLDTTPNHVHELVKSKEAFTMVKGTPVYVSGSTGNAGHVYAASASRADRMPAAYVLDEDLVFDQEGYALLTGFINNVNTSTFNEGDSVYVGANGGYTNVKPTGTNLIQKLGNVIKVDAANGSGVITGAGRANDVPNIPENYLWIGNADGVATPVSTGSLSGSFLLNTTDTFTGVLNVTGSALLTGSLSIQSGSISLKDDYDNIVIGSGTSADNNQPYTSDNVVIGRNINPTSNTTAKNENVLVGNNIGFPRGTDNTFIGHGVRSTGGDFISTGNTVIGHNAGRSIGGGNYNVIIGVNGATQGTLLTNGDNNTFIGAFTSTSTNSNQQHSIAIGYSADSKGDNTTYIGTPGITTHTYLEGLITGSSLEIGGDITGSNALFNGTVNATGDVVAYFSSDERFKDNIVEIENAVEKVESIRGVEFDWNNKQDTYTGHDIGVIAQEVEAILPEIVATRDNGYKAVKYEKLTALLLTAVKELSERVKTLEGK